MEAQAVTPTPRAAALYARRARSVWVVIAVSTLLFCVVCSAGGYSAYGYLSSVTESQHATLEKIRGQQLLVLRHLHRDYEAVEKSTVINEGDEITTGPDTEANLVLFDQSTVHMYFGTKLELSSLKSSRFVGSREDTRLGLAQGTIVMSTASEQVSAYSSPNYAVTVPDGELQVQPNSTVRVQVSGTDANRSGQAVLTFGSATAIASGKRVELQPGQMSVLAPGAGPTDAHQAEQELIRNGNFLEPPTSGKETKEGGGIGLAAWQPILEQPGTSPENTVSLSESVGNIIETLPGQTITAVSIHRDVGDGKYARVGIRQDINTAVSFYKFIGIKAAVKVTNQTDPVGGPQGDVFPLTINVIYTDSDGRQQSWTRSFYLGAARVDRTTTVNLPLGTWETIGAPDSAPPGSSQSAENTKFILKQVDATNSIGQNVSVINAVEIYGIGDRFQSSITDISMIAR